MTTNLTITKNRIGPDFSDLNLATFPQSLETMLQANLKTIAECLNNSTFTWNNLMEPLEVMEDRLERFWSPMAHLHAVVNSQALRECYQKCLPKLSAYEMAISHNEQLYQAMHSLKGTELDPIQAKIIADQLEHFELSGVALPKEEKHRFEAIQTRLSELSNQFENNVLDATQAFQYVIKDGERLKGLPDHALDAARALAVEKGEEGWILTLEYPCYIAVMTYAEDRSLRETFYEAYVTRASDQGPHAEAHDNAAIVSEILALRHEMARLLGFENYAALSLVTKMAKIPSRVKDFLSQLTDRVAPNAHEEFEALKTFAARQGLETMAPWDVAFYSEKAREAHYQINQEQLRPYFPQSKVMEGLAAILRTLYGMTMVEETDIPTWHPDVRCYRIEDEAAQLRGYIYSDLFARPNKRGGAWMDSCQTRRRLPDGDVQPPIAMLTCNFAKPIGNRPATLSHDEVLTLFHELGHCLHHVLTQVPYLSVSGIHGVEWDAVELPSQFFENWCWSEDALQLLTAHVESGESLPREMLDKCLAAKNFQAAMSLMRQLEFAWFDLRLHDDYQKENQNFVRKILTEVRQKTGLLPATSYNRFEMSFSHIFAGGYAAGYYSYLWAEVISSDAFARFEEEGIFNAQTGRDFLHNILEIGGSKEAAEAFRSFRGRAPTNDAFLRHHGLS